MIAPTEQYGIGSKKTQITYDPTTARGYNDPIGTSHPTASGFVKSGQATEGTIYTKKSASNIHANSQVGQTVKGSGGKLVYVKTSSGNIVPAYRT